MSGIWPLFCRCYLLIASSKTGHTVGWPRSTRNVVGWATIHLAPPVAFCIIYLSGRPT